MTAPAPAEDRRRPESYRTLTSAYWPDFLETWDPGVTRSAFEVRHPFFDVRLLSYVLAIPALPWCDNKELLRCALTGLVPETIRRRPKTPLRENPVAARLRRDDYGWIDGFEPCPELVRFIDRSRIPRLAGETDPETFVAATRPYRLNTWLGPMACYAPGSAVHGTSRMGGAPQTNGVTAEFVRVP
jgi:asparagine synthase (glutamine-hydrolysing)